MLRTLRPAVITRARTRRPQPPHLLRESFLHQALLSSGSSLCSHRSEASRGTPSKSTSTEAPPQEGAKCRARGGSPHTTTRKAPTLFAPSLLHQFPICNTLALHAPKPTISWVSGGEHRLKRGPTQELPLPPPHTTATLAVVAQRLDPALRSSPRPLFSARTAPSCRCSPYQTHVRGGGQTNTSTLHEYVSMGPPPASSGLDSASAAGWECTALHTPHEEKLCTRACENRSPLLPKLSAFPTALPRTQPPCKSHPDVCRGPLSPAGSFTFNNITAVSHQGRIPKLTIQKTSPQIRRDQSLFPNSGFLTA